MRQKIITALTEAATKPEARRYVYFNHVPCCIPDLPSLETVFHEAILNITYLKGPIQNRKVTAARMLQGKYTSDEKNAGRIGI